MLQHRADLDLGDVASRISRYVGPSAEDTRELVLTERDLPVQDIETQYEDLPISGGRLVESMYQAFYVSA